MTKEQYFAMRDKRNDLRELYESAFICNYYLSQIKDLDDVLEQHEIQHPNDEYEYNTRLSQRRNRFLEE